MCGCSPRRAPSPATATRRDHRRRRVHPCRPTRSPGPPRFRRRTRASSPARATTRGATQRGCRSGATATACPLRIYEVHLGSWQPELRTYRSIGEQLAEHVRTHRVHPRRAAGVRAPVRRFVGRSGATVRARSSLRHARRLPGVRRHVHRTAPASSSTGCRTLPEGRVEPGRFDGTALYEHAIPQGEHPDWGTYVFNYAATRCATSCRQRAVLDGGVPRRRAARRRGGQHAVPRLHDSAVGAEPHGVARTSALVLRQLNDAATSTRRR